MNRRTKLGPIVVASAIVLLAGQVAIAQVDWTWGPLEVPPGDPGTWDSGRHLMGDVVFDGAVWHMFLLGGTGISPIDSPWKVGHWTWNDVTLEWDLDPANPVLVPEGGQWDGHSIGSVAVLYSGGIFRMWYSAAATYLAPSYVGYATSSDGSLWTKDPTNPVAGLGPGAPGEWDNHGTAPHTVLAEGSSLHMWFFAFKGGYSGSGYSWRIGYASSIDGGATWTKDPDPVLESSEPWEGNKLYYPTVVRYGDRLAMWYTGSSAGTIGIGYAESLDGLTWTKWPDNPVLAPLPGCDYVDSSEVILQADTALGWVTNCDDVYSVKAPMVLFADGFGSGDTSRWSSAVP